MKRTSEVTAVLLAVAALGGCSKSVNQAREGIDPKPAVKAPANISAAFIVTDSKTDPKQPGALAVVQNGDRARISIQKAGLEKEFLFQGSMIQFDDAPQFKGLQSRVVAFRKRAGKLYMLEASKGHTVSNDLPSTLLLAEFPIIDENDAQITFDFNAGMSNIFVGGDWHAADGSNAHELSTDTVKTRFSYIDSAELNDRNQLAIKQVAQLALPSGKGEDNMTIELRYYISPYQPDPTFEPRKATDQEVAGFFAVAPQLRTDGSTVTYAAKFNDKKPIVYAVSANTPPEYRQAVKDGVLYWNKAFGEEKVKVVDAPAGLTAPDINYNIIQWVDYDSAGFAYADAQMDPRSGETLHAQIFMTSAWGFMGKDRARVYLKRGVSAPKSAKREIGIAGFVADRLCDREISPEEDLVSPDADAIPLKAAQDYVRSTVAHEVGHTLGMRHNFAGSLAANYQLSQRKELFDTYMRTGEAPKGVRASSTVMDYLQYEESVWEGDEIAKGTTDYEYDMKAMDILYRKKSYKVSEMPAYCTDGLQGKLADCVAHDAGASPVEFAAWNVEQQLSWLPYKIIESFVTMSKTSVGGDAIPVEEVALSPEKIAARVLSSRADLLRMMTKGTGFVDIRRQYPYISTVNIDDVRKAEQDYVAKEIEKNGGFDRLFFTLSPEYGSKAFEKFVAVLNSGRYNSGVGPDGQKYDFTDAEIATMKASAKAFFDKLNVAMVRQELVMYKAMGKLAETDAGYAFAKVLERKLYEDILMVEEGKDLVAEVEIPNEKASDDNKTEPKTKKVTITLPKFAYPQDVRVAAASLLSSDKSEALDWALVEKPRAKKMVALTVMKALGGNGFDKFKPELMPRPVARWLIENRKVLEALLSN